MEAVHLTVRTQRDSLLPGFEQEELVLGLYKETLWSLIEQ